MMEDTTKNVSKLKVYIHKEMRAEWRHREKHTAELNLTEARDTQLNIMHISGSQKQEVSTLRQTATQN